MYNPFSLAGKTILVTGASSGIGKATAIECSRMGATMVITARNEERMNETISQMEGTGHSVIPAELTNENDRKQLIERIPMLDGLVNCAGVVKILPFQFTNEEALTDMMNINFASPVLITAELVKKKKLSKNSSIVCISSISGPIVTYPGASIYAASKGAMSAIAKTMSIDLAPKGIRVNCVLPGMIETPLIHNNTLTQEQLDIDMKLYPLKRYGKPEEIAYAAIYFLSDASSWVTGSNLVIDGGFTLL